MTDTTSTAPQAGPQPTVWPCLSYADAPAAIRFLVDAFGFVEKLVVPGEGDREIVHAELRWPEGGGVMLGSSRPADDPFAVAAGPNSLYVVTTADKDGVDALYQRAVAAGAETVREPEDRDYSVGARMFTVRDPEGHLWCIGSYPGV